jgi:glucosamine--fructose-6-phosphate aminotransferase (isomerizing)
MSAALGAAMERELAQAPAAVVRQRAAAGGWIGALRDLVPPGGLRGVALTARGTSDHAAAYGRHLLEQAAGVPAWSTAPSLLTRYDASVSLAGVLAIAVSQSGATPEIVAVLERQRAAGARTVAITNDPDSPLAAAAHVAIGLEAGPETAVPATKTFTATLHAFALMAEALEWGEGRFAVDGPALDAALAAAVADAGAVDGLAARLATHEVVVHLGRGPLLPIAREAALKLIETTATAHLAWSTVDVRHGPLALARRGTPVVLHHAPGPVAADATQVAAILAEAGVAPAVIGEPLDGAAEVVPAPGDLAEHLRPLVHAIRIQQLALAVARARGVDPDQPAGLSKVTATT